MNHPLVRLTIWLAMAPVIGCANACFAQSASFQGPEEQPSSASPSVTLTPPSGEAIVSRADGAQATASFLGFNPWSEPPASSAPQTADSPESAAPTADALGTIGLQANQLTNEGLKLAAKDAAYSARAKFTSALELIADALDARQQTQFHSRSLAGGVLALREADDFSRPGANAAAALDPVTVAIGHVTPLLHNARPGAVTRLQALRLYFSFATSQLAASVGHVPEASTALYYLGRIEPFLGDSATPGALAQPKAMALQQAAVMVNPQNFRAANELGVLLTRFGQLDLAREAFLYSLAIQQRPETLQNLAIVSRALGNESDARALAKVARDEKVRLANEPSRPDHSFVYLVDHKTFAAGGVAADPGPTGVPGGPPQPANRLAATPVGYMDPVPPAPHDVSPTPGMRPGMPPGAPFVGGPSAEFLQPPAWEVFAQGEYIGPARLQHVPDYCLRVDDQLGFVFRLNGRPSATPYRLGVGDIIRIASLTSPTPALDTPIQPDGTIFLPQVGPIMAVGKTIEGLRAELEQQYRQFLKEPAITVTPVSVNRAVEELRSAISNRNGIFAGQAFQAKVTPDGSIQLPAVGPVHCQGLDLLELRSEVEQRYAELFAGVEITPVLVERAPRSIYVLGEVAKPGKFLLDGPTTVIQAISFAGSWNIGGNLRQVIVFRRDDQWRLMATRVNVRPALYNSRHLDADDIWLRDNDIVIVPKSCIQVFDDWVTLVFTKGLYGIVPFGGVSFSFFRDLSSVGGATVL